jgi:hypothetical protein
MILWDFLFFHGLDHCSLYMLMIERSTRLTPPSLPAKKEKTSSSTFHFTTLWSISLSDKVRELLGHWFLTLFIRELFVCSFCGTGIWILGLILARPLPLEPHIVELCSQKSAHKYIFAGFVGGSSNPWNIWFPGSLPFLKF